MFVGISDLTSKRLTTDIPYEELYVHSGKTIEEMWQQSLERSPIYWAHQSKTAVLILGGAADPRVHPGQSIEFYRLLKMNDHPAVRLVQYPGEGHGNAKQPGRADVLYRLLDWFDWYVQRREAARRPDAAARHRRPLRARARGNGIEEVAPKGRWRMKKNDKELSRRSFIGRSLASLAGVGLGLAGAKGLRAQEPGAPAAQPGSPAAAKPAIRDYRDLGRTGWKTSDLGFGNAMIQDTVAPRVRDGARHQLRRHGAAVLRDGGRPREARSREARRSSSSRRSSCPSSSRRKRPPKRSPPRSTRA